MNIHQIKGQTPEIVSSVITHCENKRYEWSFIDRLTIAIRFKTYSSLLWFGCQEGNSKTYVLNRLDKEINKYKGSDDD
mgnify:CR=1 FL=1